MTSIPHCSAGRLLYSNTVLYESRPVDCVGGCRGAAPASPSTSRETWTHAGDDDGARARSTRGGRRRAVVASSMSSMVGLDARATRISRGKTPRRGRGRGGRARALGRRRVRARHDVSRVAARVRGKPRPHRRLRIPIAPFPSMHHPTTPLVRLTGCEENDKKCVVSYVYAQTVDAG